MRDTQKPLRKAIYDCLNGTVMYNGSAVPIYDEKIYTGSTPSVYILLSTQQEQDRTDQDCAWQTKSSINLVIVSKTGSEVSKDHVDDISQAIYDLLLTLPGSNLLAAQAGLTILELRRESSISGEVRISPTQSELQKIVSLTAYIFHQ